MAVPPGTTPRGPTRFIDGIPTIYRFFETDEAAGGVSGQVANFVAESEFHLQDYRDKQPMLTIGPGEYPNADVADMKRGLSMFELVNKRPTFLKVFYFNGTEMAPIEPTSPQPNHALQPTAGALGVPAKLGPCFRPGGG